MITWYECAQKANNALALGDKATANGQFKYARLQYIAAMEWMDQAIQLALQTKEREQ